MYRYKFLLLAFFLSLTAFGANESLKKTSNRTVNELGNIQESTTKAQQPPAHSSLNNVNPAGAPEAATGKTTALSSVSCKTYEGKVFDQGDAGYNDCINTIKNDRQKTKTVP